MRKLLIISTSMMLFLVLGVGSASANFQFVGDWGLGHSWFQRFQETNLLEFNTLRIDRIVGYGSSAFEPPVFRNFSSSGWSEDTGSTGDLAQARGAATSDALFDLNFTGNPVDRVAFRFVAYQGLTWRDAAEARFDGTSWYLIELDASQYDPGVLTPVPEPSPAALLAIGLFLTAGLMLVKRQV